MFFFFLFTIDNSFPFPNYEKSWREIKILLKKRENKIRENVLRFRI